MPRKELRLLARDLWFFATGGADCAPSDWRREGSLYPLDWGYQLDRPSDYFEPFDQSGLPMREIEGTIPRTYLPSRIAAYALANWNRRESGANKQTTDRFLTCAEWFAVQPDGAFRYQFPLVGMKPGWLSCIGQGEGISVLVRAHWLTRDPRFSRAAEQAAAWLHRPLVDGGLLDRLPDGSAFLEEYPGTQYRHVLNGCLYGLVGLADLATFDLDDAGEHGALCDSVIDALAHNLARWELGRGWTTYDFQSADPDGAAPANPNTLTYQTLVWILLDYLATVRDRSGLSATAQEWRAATARPSARFSALKAKIRYRLSHGYRR